MTDPLRDERFPDRPQHPDFWRLSSVVTQADGKVVEGGMSARDVAAEVVDVDSLTYMAMNRAAMILNKVGMPQSDTMVAVLGALWTDAFVAGVQFQREGGHRGGPR